MRTFKIGAMAFAFSAFAATVALAQSGQMGPAKTPNGSMPAAPSNSTASQGSTMAPASGMASKKMRKTSSKRMKKQSM